MTKKKIETAVSIYGKNFGKSKMVSVEDLQTVTDILAKLDTQIKSLDKALKKANKNGVNVIYGKKADELDVKNNIASVSNYIHWIGMKLIHNIPNEETPLTLSAEDDTTLEIAIEGGEK